MLAIGLCSFIIGICLMMWGKSRMQVEELGKKKATLLYCLSIIMLQGNMVGAYSIAIGLFVEQHDKDKGIIVLAYFLAIIAITIILSFVISKMLFASIKIFRMKKYFENTDRIVALWIITYTLSICIYSMAYYYFL